LSEAINKVSKLTGSQLNALSICWLFNRTSSNLVHSFESLKVYLDTYIKVFESNLLINDHVDYLHLAYTGTAMEMSHGSVSIIEILMRNYPGVFYKSITKDEILSTGLDMSVCDKFFFADKLCEGKYSFRVANYNVLNSKIDLFCSEFESYNLIKTKLPSVYNCSKMTKENASAKIVELCPYMAHVFRIWDQGRIGHMYPTSVGIVLAHANYSTFDKSFGDVSRWI
jgi:hypothetical protein